MFQSSLSAVQHERGPRKPKLRPTDATSSAGSTGSLTHIHQRQLNINRARHQQYLRQPYANVGPPIGSTRSSLARNTVHTTSIIPTHQQSLTSLNQCNASSGQSVSSRGSHNGVRINGEDSLDLHHPAMALSNSGTHLLTNQQPYYSQSKLIQNLNRMGYNHVRTYDQRGSNDIALPSMSNSRPTSSQVISDQSFSSSEHDEDASEEIIVDVEHDGGLYNHQNATDGNIRSTITIKQPNQPDKHKLTTGRRTGADLSNQMQPLDIQSKNGSNLITRSAQTNYRNLGCSDLSSSYHDNLHPRSVLDSHQQQQVAPSTYAQPVCGLDQSPMRSVPSENHSGNHSGGLNTNLATTRQHEEMLGLGSDGENFSALPNSLSSGLQMNVNIPSLSIPGDHALNASVNQALRNQQLRNSIFASFLSRLSCSIESQALLTLLLKNNCSSNQKSASVQQQIKQTITNNSLQQPSDINKAGLPLKAMPCAISINNGAIKSPAIGGDASLGFVPYINVPSMNQQRLGNLGNSPTNSSCPSGQQDNNNQTILNTAASISSPFVSVSTTTTTTIKGDCDSNDSSGGSIGAINIKIPNQQQQLADSERSTNRQQFNTVAAGLPTDVSPFVTSSKTSTSNNNHLPGPASMSRSRQQETTPTSSSSSLIDFKNIDSLITPNDSLILPGQPTLDSYYF